MPQFSEQDLKPLHDMARKSVLGTPSEYAIYGVITEAFILHKWPQDRYTIFPQLRLPWNPNQEDDLRGSIPDFGFGRYYNSFPHVRLYGAAEVKKATPSMAHLPSVKEAFKDLSIQRGISSALYQAEDQAKSAVKGGLLPRNKTLLWLIFVGPYFTKVEFGPFTKAQLQTRGHKPNDSGDWREALKIQEKKDHAIITTYPLYLLGTVEAAQQLEWYFHATAKFL